jgi:uncharacterized membrane protein required for colicin V production
MSIFDIILLVIILAFMWKGFRAGLVGAIGGFIGIIVAIWAGSHYMQMVATWLMKAINIDNEGFANILSFIVIFIAVNIIFSIIIAAINRIFHIVPFIDLANKILGSFVGFFAGALTVAIIVYLLSIFPISNTFSDALIKSQIAHWAANVAVVVKPFIPEAIKSLKSIL